MVYDKTQQSSSCSPAANQHDSQTLYRSRPFAVEAKPNSSLPLTPEQQENEDFQQDRFEVTQLELQAKYGTLASEGQKRLGVLQAKMNGLLQRRVDQASRFGHNFANIAIAPPENAPDIEPVKLIQTKLTLGQPGDQYEQEADHVADQVMRMPDFALRQPVQREVLPEDEEEVQTKPLAASITPLLQREAMLEEEEEPVQTKSLVNTLQREAMPEEEEKELVQTKPSPTADSQQPTQSIESRLNNSKSEGSPLSDEVRSFMEPRFGFNFSQVRVHTDSEAVQMNRELNAQAFTHGSHIYFGEGKSPANDNLTAHEMTHVLQQTGGEQLHAKFFNSEAYSITIANSQDGLVQRYPDTILEVAQMGFAESILRLSIDQAITNNKEKKDLINEAFWTAYPQMKGQKINDENVPDPEQKKTYIDAYLYIQNRLYPKVEKEAKRVTKPEADDSSQSNSIGQFFNEAIKKIVGGGSSSGSGSRGSGGYDVRGSIGSDVGATAEAFLKRYESELSVFPTKSQEEMKLLISRIASKKQFTIVDHTEYYKGKDLPLTQMVFKLRYPDKTPLADVQIDNYDKVPQTELEKNNITNADIEELKDIRENLVYPLLRFVLPKITAKPELSKDATVGEQIADQAHVYIGVKYHRKESNYDRETGQGTLDCSDLVRYVFTDLGLKYKSGGGSNGATIVGNSPSFEAVSDLQIGDLVLRNSKKGSGFRHVGIYVGDNMVIHAPFTGTVVRKEPYQNWDAIRRYTVAENQPSSGGQ